MFQEAQRATQNAVTTMASVQGTFARTCGVLGSANPYLALPAVSGEPAGAWLARCDAWWQGWDIEDRRRADAAEGFRRFWMP